MQCVFNHTVSTSSQEQLHCESDRQESFMFRVHATFAESVRRLRRRMGDSCYLTPAAKLSLPNETLPSLTALVSCTRPVTSTTITFARNKEREKSKRKEIEVIGGERNSYLKSLYKMSDANFISLSLCYYSSWESCRVAHRVPILSFLLSIRDTILFRLFMSLVRPTPGIRVR